MSLVNDSSQADLHADDDSRWPLDQDGYPHRRAARALLIGPGSRVLLVRGHDQDDAAHTWWFTVGGGIESGEDARDAAIREIREETGVHLSRERLSGPVLTRHATFHFARSTRKQDEVFFLAYLDPDEANHVGEGTQLTEAEKHVLDEFGFFTPDQIDALVESGTAVYPAEIAVYVRMWSNGWDGRMLSISED
ncbi:MAG: NUDIX domain-containing protein [Actinomycetaceae bacterium]|nr:NUDIX domain-containing protein [Actinomycetaceae bacterium]MDY6083269.1 NUDIX domain-containing protein [Actinomycetaceae bacterium]